MEDMVFGMREEQLWKTWFLEGMPGTWYYLTYGIGVGCWDNHGAGEVMEVLESSWRILVSLQNTTRWWWYINDVICIGGDNNTSDVDDIYDDVNVIDDHHHTDQVDNFDDTVEKVDNDDDTEFDNVAAADDDVNIDDGDHNDFDYDDIDDNVDAAIAGGGMHLSQIYHAGEFSKQDSHTCARQLSQH